MHAGTLDLSPGGPMQQAPPRTHSFLALQLLGADLFTLAEGGAFARSTAGRRRLAAVGASMVKVRALQLLAAATVVGGEKVCKSMRHTALHFALLQALEYTHGRGYVHGDVKPGGFKI